MNPQILIYGLYTWALLVTAVVVIMCIWTPAIPFLAARIGKNKGVAIVSGKSPLLRFVSAKYLGGQWKTKNYGEYDEAEDSVYFAFKTPIVFVHEFQARTISGLFLRALQALRKITSIKDWRDYKKTIDDNQNKAVEVPVETIQINRLTNMAPYINDPHIRQKGGAAEIVVQKVLGEDKNKSLRNWLILLLIGAVVAFIAWKLFLGGNSQAVEVICKYPEQILNGAQIQGTGGNLTL